MHNSGFYNPFLSQLFLNHSATLTESAACLGQIENLTFIDIEMTSHDALKLTTVPTKNVVKEISSVGEQEGVINFNPLFLTIFNLIGGYIGLYTGSSFISLVEVLYFGLQALLSLMSRLKPG